MGLLCDLCFFIFSDPVMEPRTLRRDLCVLCHRLDAAESSDGSGSVCEQAFTKKTESNRREEKTEVLFKQTIAVALLYAS